MGVIVDVFPNDNKSVIGGVDGAYNSVVDIYIFIIL
jgi:hypothetical protein